MREAAVHTTHVVGTGRYLPAQVLTNAEISASAGVEEAWIIRRTGIRERRVAAPGEGAAEMAEHAALSALESSGTAAEAVSVVVVATSTPDHLTPPTACELQARLGTWSAACFDIEAGFAGWIYALLTADALLRSGLGETAVVVGVEKLSTVTDRTDPSTAPLFGDGAGAVVLRRGPGPLSILGRSWWANGRLAGALRRPGGGALQPFDSRVLDERTHLLRMEGSRLFRPAIRTMATQAGNALAKAGMKLDEIDLIVPHQANLRIIDGLARELGVDDDRIWVNIARFGNTGAATIPIALDEALRAERITRDRPILLVSFGAGATAGAAVLGPPPAQGSSDTGSRASVKSVVLR
jgi:3-oxoacyl-[acyl-carrier-protein] synthase III